MNFDEAPAGCYDPEHWLIAHGKEPLPDKSADSANCDYADENSFEGFEGVSGESENEFSPFTDPELDKLPPFPEHCLPDPLWDMLSALGENLQTAGGMFGAPLLAACAICLQGKVLINPKPGWIEPLNLYTVTIARPSERKSPAIRVVVKPIREFEIEKNQERKPLIDEWNSRMRILSGKLKQAEKNAIEGKAGATEEKVFELQEQIYQLEQNEEKPLKLYADDVTPEALISLMARYDGRMALISSEGGLFDIAAGRYSDRANLDVFTKAYSGDTIRINRVNRPEEDIQNPALTLVLMTQPSVLKTIMGNSDFEGQGFLARFLYSLPPSPVGKRRYETYPVPTEVEEAYTALLRSLLDIQPDEGKPRVIRLSPEAHQKAKAYAEALEPRLNEDLEFIEAWAGKLHGQIMRIAGILHCCKYGDEMDAVPLELDTMQKAETIGNYFLEHSMAAFRISGLADDQATKDAKYILKRLESTGKTEIKKRDLQQLCKDRAGLETAEDMEPGLAVLVKRGYIKLDIAARNPQNPQNPRKGGRPSWMVYLTPEYIEWKQRGELS